MFRRSVESICDQYLLIVLPIVQFLNHPGLYCVTQIPAVVTQFDQGTRATNDNLISNSAAYLP